MKAVPIMNCASVSISAQLTAPAPKQGYVLATNSGQFTSHAGTARNLTPNESAELRKAAGTVLSRKNRRVDTSKSEIRSGTATDLDGDGIAELIGSVVVPQGTAKEHRIFLVLKKEGEYKPILVSHAERKESDGDAPPPDDNYVGQIDVNGDGTDEIVTIRYYYESFSFSVFETRGQKWVRIYEGGGGGC